MDERKVVQLLRRLRDGESTTEIEKEIPWPFRCSGGSSRPAGIARGRRVDACAKAIMPTDFPESGSYLPYEVYGDGNCLFRSASLLATGTEKYHLELRLRSVVELVLHSEFHGTELAGLAGRCASSGHFSATSLLQSTLKEASDEEFIAALRRGCSTREAYASSLRCDALEAAKSGVYASLPYLSALATVIGVSFRSVYPNANSTLRPLYHGVLRPRPGAHTTEPRLHQPLHIMFSEIRTSKHGVTSGLWMPNHFVPLIHQDEKESSTQVNQRRPFTILDFMKPKPKAKVQPEPKAKVNPEPKAKVNPEPKAKLNPEPKATVNPEPKATVNPEPKATVNPEPKAKVNPEPKAKVNPEPNTTPLKAEKNAFNLEKEPKQRFRRKKSRSRSSSPESREPPFKRTPGGGRLSMINSTQRASASGHDMNNKASALHDLTGPTHSSSQVQSGDVGQLLTCEHQDPDVDSTTCSWKWTKEPRTLSAEEKLRLLQFHFVPGSRYSFPVQQQRGEKRVFRHEWLQKNSWLCYSPKWNGGFCLPCLLFSSDGGGGYGDLYRTPMRNFVRASTLLKRHGEQKSHLESMMKAAHFSATHQQGKPTVHRQLQKYSDSQVEENMAKLRAIIAAIEYLGKQGLPFRGHGGEAAFDPAAKEQPKENPGNFLALLRLLVHRGDTALAKTFHTTPGPPVTYQSAEIQNDLIGCFGEVIQAEILQEVRRAKFFSISADEACDISNKEQLPLVLRFVDQANHVREEFVDFILCDTGLSGKALAGKILDWMEDHSLPMERCRGQAYDGAGSMAGRLNGCSSIITSKFPDAMYVHCTAHCLNLCVMATSHIVEVRNMWTTLKEVSLFFSNSPKRQAALEEHLIASIDQSEPPKKIKKLVDLCRTRWVARHTALNTFQKLYLPVCETLKDMEEDVDGTWRAESSRTAQAHLLAISSFRFIATFIITKKYCQ